MAVMHLAVVKLWFHADIPVVFHMQTCGGFSWEATAAGVRIILPPFVTVS